LSIALLIARRVIRAIATFLVASFLVYGALYLSPGSPLAALTGGRTLPPSAVHALEAQYHLNDSFLKQYWLWLKGVLHGDFGQSIAFHDSVGSLLNARIGTTLFLVVYAGVLIIAIGVLLGVIAAVREGAVDGVITVSTTVGLATPSFVVAVGLIALFAVNLGWFPVFGSGHGFVDRLWHLTLPAIALALAGLAYVSQITRAAVREELSGEQVQTARSRGIPDRLILWRHVVRNAAIPITTVAGLSVASLVAGVAVVETAFSLNGIGSYLIQAVQEKDFAVVQAITLILVGIFIVTNAIVDILYYVLDPRLRVRGAA
jgi:peptide/nickel transport system permease protein